MENGALFTTRKALENEIATHTRAIIDLKGRLNTMTTIARLPPELLSEIFLQITKEAYDDHRDCHRPYYGASRFYAWVRVAHVCHSWRSVALNTPRLWGYVILTRRQVVEDVLALSKKAPLLVSASLMNTADERAQIMDKIAQESARLQELRLSGPARFVQDLCSKLTGTANILETLALSDNGDHFHSNAGDTTLSAVFRRARFQRLRSLEMRRLLFNWAAPIFSSSLTRLILSCSSGSQSLIGSFDELLSALQTMHNLEFLELEDAIPPLPVGVTALPTPQCTVALPKLRRITLIGQSLDCANLIHHLSLSPTTRTTVVGRGNGGAQQLISVVGERVVRDKPLLTVRLSRMYGTKLQLRGWRKVVEQGALEPCVELQLDALAYPSLASHLVRDSKMLPKVRNLEIDSQYHDWRWRDVFTGMPNLRTLSVCGDVRNDFVAALSVTRKGKKNRPPSMILPHLRVVNFTGTRMCNPDYDHVPEFLDKLEDWLLLRCNYNLPIDKLRLTDCLNFCEEDAARLDGVVPYLDWDGLEQYESEDEEDEDEDEDMFYEEGWDYDYYDDYYGDPWGFF
ncbi:hypothetical protein C2E23DRAFT_807649 [Lenzites betulinus]|nr:hypothetical protein C2E23DRAFT_807649 [Lenzites betulinus]